MTEIRQDTILPGAQVPAALVAGRSGVREWGVLRYGDTVVVAHPDRMTLEEARAVGAALFELASEE